MLALQKESDTLEESLAVESRHDLGDQAWPFGRLRDPNAKLDNNKKGFDRLSLSKPFLLLKV